MDCLIHLSGVLGRGWGLKYKSESHQMQMAFKGKCFELLGKKSCRVIIIVTFVLWHMNLCLGIPIQSLDLSLIYLCVSRAAGRWSDIYVIYVVPSYTEVWVEFWNQENSDEIMPWTLTSSVSVEAIQILRVSVFPSAKWGLTSISQDRQMRRCLRKCFWNPQMRCSYFVFCGVFFFLVSFCF